MNILFVCHRLPFPPNRGGKIRPFHMIQHLSQKHAVTVASLAHSQVELERGTGLHAHCAAVLAEVVPRELRWMQAVAALTSSTPSSVAYFRSARLHRRVREAWQRTRFDAVIVHCAFVAQYVLDLRGGFRIMDFGDLDSGKWFGYAAHRALPLSLGYRIEAKKLRRYEKELAGQFDQYTVTTPGELEEFKTFGVTAPCRVVPNGVDAAYFHPKTRPRSDSSVIAFLGRMDYFPNVDGIVHFARRVFPLIRQAEPRAELRIIGSNPTRAVRELAAIPGVSVTGEVPDVRPPLEDAAVGIAPLRIARGTQNKILQLMAMGIPVVSTPQAAEGIQAVPGRDLLVAGDVESYAAQVVELLRNKSLHAALAEAGRRQVEAAHAWPQSMKILDSMLEAASATAARPHTPVASAVRNY